MSWLNVFKLYNLKKIKSEKVVFIFTALSIFLTTLISLLVPQITINNKEVMDRSVREVNGGSLIIQANYPSKKFNDELEVLKKEGYEVNINAVANGYYKSNNNKKTVGRLISGNFNISENEIILYKSISNNLDIKVGDKVEVKSSENGVKSYIVKKIENMPCGVDGDSKTLGYGKILSYKNTKVKSSSLVIINGGDGEKLKERLKNIEDGYVYTSLKDREKLTQRDIDNEIISYSVITEMVYILSIITIITITVMILLKRKRDLAILKMLGISNTNLKMGIILELSLTIIIPILLAGICSFKLSSYILIFNETSELIGACEKIKIIFKGIIFNLLLFFIFLNMALRIMKNIKPLSIIRNNTDELRKNSKKIIFSSIVLIPIILFLYSLYIGRLSAFAGGILIILFLGIFLLITVLVLKLLTLIPFKNSVLLYTFKNIRKNFMSFTMILLSITMSIVFLLMGFTLGNTVKDSMNTAIESSLPYKYILLTKNDKNLDKDLVKNKYVNNYSKFYNINGKVTNSNIKFKSITIAEVKNDDYKAKYKILEGEDIFQGDKEGVLISNKYKKINKLNIGDFINVETLYGNFRYKIKGVYDGGEFNSQSILKQYSGIGQETINYMINSNSDKWMNNIKDSYIVSVDFLSTSISHMINKLLDIFKVLCFFSIFSSILFNINMVYMNYIENKKDESIIVALGIGKEFCIKYQMVKVMLLIATSTVMGFGIYALVLKTVLKLFLNAKVFISPMYLLGTIIISIMLSIISFNMPIRDIKKQTSFQLLKE